MIIYKFVIEVMSRYDLKLPVNSTILSVQNQGEKLCVWAKIDDAEEHRTQASNHIQPLDVNTVNNQQPWAAAVDDGGQSSRLRCGGQHVQRRVAGAHHLGDVLRALSGG